MRVVASSTDGQDFDLCYTMSCGTTSFTKVWPKSKFTVGFNTSSKAYGGTELQLQYHPAEHCKTT